MDKFQIKGPCKIKGEVEISGAKNSALVLLAATLLFDKPVTLKNLPRVRDIDTMLNLLRSLGSKIILSKDKKIVKIHNKKKVKNISQVFTCQDNESIHTCLRTINIKIS